MAQQFPTTAQVVYDTLAADTIFTDYLGTYEFRAGQTMPALSIVSAGEDLPALRNVQGVECIIQDAGPVQPFPYISDDLPRLRVTWSVFLVAWEGASGADMQEATERVCRRFHGSVALQVVATADGLGAQVQNKIQIYSDMPILAA